MRVSTISYQIFLFLVLLFLAICCTSCGGKRPVATSAELLSLRQDFVRVNNAEYQEQLDTMLRRMEQELTGSDADGPPTFDVLVVHGGGPAGGFAAGVLEGWGEVEDPTFARPEFDVVTGSSSGSLVAPFAFAGQDSDYARLAAYFENPPQKWGGTGFFSMWPYRSAILNASDLHRMVRSVIDTNLVKEILRGEQELRSLFVMTTDMDLGLARYWDLGAEAAQLAPEEGAERIEDILLAATALPVVLPPMEIDGTLHSDGAIAASMFLGFGYRGFLTMYNQWRDRHPGTPFPEVRFWTIVNGKLFEEGRTVNARYPDIAARTIQIALQYDRLKSIYLSLHLIEWMDALEGVEATYRYVVIPDDAKLPADLTELSDRDLARNVVEVGRQIGRDISSWTAEPPPLGRLPEAEPVKPGQELP